KASQAQERFFLVSQFDAMEKGAHLPSAFLVKGDLQSERLKPIFQEIVDRHEALRTSYEIIDGEVVQCISEKSQVEIVREDGEGKSLEEIFSEFIVPFDLHHAPLFRVKLILLGEKTNILLTDIHHSIADGYSCTLIMKEFMERYLGRKEFGKPATYLDYLNFQEEYRNSLEYTEDVKYWKSQLLDANDKVTFPSECKKSDKTPKAGGSVLEVIDVNTTKELKQFAKEMKCSLYQLLYSAYSLLLSKMSGALDFTIGIPVDMRGEGRFDETIGMLTNTMVIRNHLNPDWNFETYLCENRKQFAKAFQHRRIPYEEMVSLLGTHSSSLFEVMFVFENAEERVNQIDNLICENLDIPLTDSYYDISMEIIESGGELKVQVYYKQEHYQVEDARQILSYYKELITSIMDCRDKKVMDYLSCYEEKWKPLQCQTVIAERNVQKKEETVISEGSITSQEYIEKELIAYWQECLKIEHIDRNQNFFDMGGKSLDGIRLVNEWKKKYEISITDLFRYSTIASLSDVLANRSQQLNSLEGKAVNVNESLGTKKDNRGDHPTVPVEVANHQQMPIAIIGMAGCFPQSDDVEEFWKNLSEGKECITFFEEEELLQEGFTKSELEQEDYVKAKGVLEHADCFDAAFFGYTPKEVEMMDPQIRLFHQCAWNALEDAGYGPLSANAGGDRPFNAGVFAGSASNYTWMSQIYQPTDDVNRRVERISLNDKDYMSTRISYKLNLNGPSYGVQTACSTSLAAIHLACRSLELGECNIALAGGVCLMLPKKTGYRYQEGMILSKDGHCKVFGEDATGTVFSDGVGAVVLKPLADAMRDGDCIYAVIKGTAVNNDGNRKAGYTAPSIEGQAEVILKAYQHAGIEASTVTYVETHGTGTVLGDPIEIEGLKTVYPKEEKSYCALGSLKSNYGHLDAAGGVAGVIKAALALKNRKIPKTLYTDKTNPQIALEDSPFYFPQETIAWMQKTGEDGTPIPRRAGISAFGFGGTNAHIVLEEAPCSTAEEPERCKDNEREQKLIVLSAKRKQELIALKEKMIHFLSENPAVSLEAMESVLQLGRKGYAYREAYVVSSVEELTKKLSKDNGLLKPCSQTKTQIVFLFTGQGSQYVNMARELYQSDKVFHELMEDAFMILHEEIDYRSILYPDKESIGNEGDCSGLINQTENAQIILFILEYAMASYLIKLGVKPDVLIGHSLGEYVAATVAGVFTLEEGLTLVRQRAKLMQSMQPGAMDMVLLPEQDLLSELKIAEVSLAVAAVNGPEQC
ncbi:MAG: acyltransferase domain-containing protein, partial [Clostridium sp.]|nr:acyltransferase domain-containing protein [Clostridium sp.]